MSLMKHQPSTCETGVKFDIQIEGTYLFHGSLKRKLETYRKNCILKSLFARHIHRKYFAMICILLNCARHEARLL